VRFLGRTRFCENGPPLPFPLSARAKNRPSAQPSGDRAPIGPLSILVAGTLCRRPLWAQEMRGALCGEPRARDFCPPSPPPPLSQNAHVPTSSSLEATAHVSRAPAVGAGHRHGTIDVHASGGLGLPSARARSEDQFFLRVGATAMPTPDRLLTTPPPNHPQQQQQPTADLGRRPSAARGHNNQQQQQQQQQQRRRLPAGFCVALRSTAAHRRPAVAARAAGADDAEAPPRRVVVTGLGVVSPLGNEHDAFYSALLEGRSGVAQIESFDASDFSTRFAGEVKVRDEGRGGGDAAAAFSSSPPLASPFSAAASRPLNSPAPKTQQP
jgi:hypothetical protein